MRKEAEDKGKPFDSRKVKFADLGIERKSISEKMRYLKIDISIDESSDEYQKFPQFDPRKRQAVEKSHSGIETIYYIQEQTKKRSDLRPLVMIIKKIFDDTFLSVPYQGGISSFSLFLMACAYLNSFDEEAQMSLSSNLSGFFHFFGA